MCILEDFPRLQEGEHFLTVRGGGSRSGLGSSQAASWMQVAGRLLWLFAVYVRLPLFLEVQLVLG